MNSAAYKEIQDFVSRQTVRFVDVPALNNKRIYFKPFSPAAKSLALRLIEPGESQSALNTAYVCVNALTETGEKLFVPEDCEGMKHWTVGNAFDEIVERMNSFTPIEEAKKS